jgi:hypothetical protein
MEPVPLISDVNLVSIASGLEQEPGSALGFVNEVFEKTCGRYVAVLIAQGMGLPHALGQVFVVVMELGEHIGP